MPTIRTYQRRITKLTDLLRSIEWVQPMYNGSPSCSCCGYQQHQGHASDCELNAILSQPKEGDSVRVRNGNKIWEVTSINFSGMAWIVRFEPTRRGERVVSGHVSVKALTKVKSDA